MPTGIIEIKIGSCLSMPTKTMNKVLEELAYRSNIARNAMIRAWQRWREDNPGYTPAQARKRDGSPKFTAAGKPVMEADYCSQDAWNSFYHVGRQAAGYKIAKSIISPCWNEVQKELETRMPYNHTGKAKYKWEAILLNEVQAPSFRSEMIHVANNSASFSYCGDSTSTVKYGFGGCGKSSCILQFTVFGREYSSRNKSVVCRLKVKQLPRGKRALLRRIASRDLKFKDSKIVQKNGKWYFQLAYDVPVTNHGLDDQRQAVLYACGPDAKQPFRLEMPNGYSYYVGDGLPLLREYERLTIRRKERSYRYKHGAGAGHGRGRFFAKVRPYERAHKNMCDRFTKLLVSDIIKLCVRNNCGTLIYREPSIPLRDQLWFAKNDIPFNWTDLCGRLTFKAGCNVIEMPKPTTTRMRSEEYKDLCAA